MHKILYIKDDVFATYKLLMREFKKIDYVVSEEVMDGRRQVSFTSPSGNDWKTSVSKINYPFNSPSLRSIAINKEVACEFAQSSGVSTPDTQLVPESVEITPTEIDMLLKRHRKLIVKPSNSSLSRGLTLNVQTPESLLAAIARARDVSKTVLIQQQVEGEEVRFIVLEGKVVAALLRRTPRVIGDGISTVAELIRKENEDRKGLDLAVNYPVLSDAMVGQSIMENNNLLPLGEVLELNRSTMIRYGASIYDVFDRVHPSYIETTEKLVAQLGSKFIVVDIIITDFTSRQTENNYWFIEFNTSPMLGLCYGCRDGKMFDIVPSLVGVIDRWLNLPIGANLSLTEV